MNNEPKIPQLAWTSAADLRCCMWFNRWGNRRAILALFKAVSKAGDGFLWVALILGVGLSNPQEHFLPAAHLTVVALTSLLLYRTLKTYIRRPRPYQSHDLVTAFIPPLDEFSFPSGHTLHAVSLSAICISYFPLTALFLVPVAVMIALSRVILGVHYPSDVIAASIIGLTLAELSFQVIEVTQTLGPA